MYIPAIFPIFLLPLPVEDHVVRIDAGSTYAQRQRDRDKETDLYWGNARSKQIAGQTMGILRLVCA